MLFKNFILYLDKCKKILAKDALRRELRLFKRRYLIVKKLDPATLRGSSSALGTTIKARNGSFWRNLSILSLTVLIWMQSSVVNQLRFMIIDEVLPQNTSNYKECMAIWRYFSSIFCKLWEPRVQYFRCSF